MTNLRTVVQGDLGTVDRMVLGTLVLGTVDRMVLGTLVLGTVSRVAQVTGELATGILVTMAQVTVVPVETREAVRTRKNPEAQLMAAQALVAAALVTEPELVTRLEVGKVRKRGMRPHVLRTCRKPVAIRFVR